MSHRYGIKLASFSGGGDGYRLLIRVVSVDDNDKVNLPIRELWARREDERDTKSEISYIMHSANCPEDSVEESVSLEEANDSMRTTGGFWLKSLSASGPIGRGGLTLWLPTRVVRTEPCIWESKFYSPLGVPYHVIDEKNLGVWLDGKEESADEDNSEADWWCLSCLSCDEDSEDASEKEDEVSDDDEDENGDDGGASLDYEGDDPDAKPVGGWSSPRFWWRGYDHWGEDIDGGYDGDVEKGSIWGKR